MIDDEHEAAIPRRIFLRLAGGRRVHMIVSGAGPAVLLLPESPRSARVLAPLAAALGPNLTAIAIDPPGYGLSDPLPLRRPEIGDFAQAAAEAMAALGLRRYGVYGVHTGAQVAAELAAGWPDEVAFALLDGFPVFTPAETADLIPAVLPPLRPDWAGACVATLWARVRDQSAFFPWSRAGDGARLPLGPAPLAATSAALEDLLAAGDGYRVGYAAAFRHDAAAVMTRLGASALFAAREDDVLAAHLDRPAPWPAGTEALRLPPGRDAAARVFAALFAERLAGEPHADLAGVSAGDLWNTPDGLIMVERSGPAEGRGVVILHDLPGGPEADAELARRIAVRAPVWRVGLPGTAQSARGGAWRADPAGVADAIASALTQAGAAGALVVARGASAALGPGIAAATGGRLVLADPPCAPAGPEALDEAAPDLAPRWDGGHLHALWWALRDGMLYRPGWRREAVTHRPFGEEPDLDALFARFSAAVVAGPVGSRLARACLANDDWRSAGTTEVVSTAGRTEGAFGSETTIQPGDAALSRIVLDRIRSPA